MVAEHHQAFFDFVASIPDHCLQDFSDSEHTIFNNDDFRLDMQGLSKQAPISFRLWVQPQSKTKLKFFKKSTKKGPKSIKHVSKLHLPIDSTWTPQQVRDSLVANVDFTGGH